MRKRTDNYIFTFDFNCADDAFRLADLRKTVALSNKMRIPGQPRLRVTVRGRLGKNNPAYAKYRGRFYGQIDMKDAVRADVYVHQRFD
jgi:hypothetical protein